MTDQSHTARWMLVPEAAGTAFWEAAFPGHGTALADLVRPLVGWEPSLAPSDADAFKGLAEATRWLGVTAVEGVPLKDFNRLPKPRPTPLARVLLQRAAELGLSDGARRVVPAVKRAFSFGSASPAEIEEALATDLVNDRIDALAWHAVFDLVVFACTFLVAGHQEGFACLRQAVAHARAGRLLVAIGVSPREGVGFVLTGDPPASRVLPPFRQIGLDPVVQKGLRR